jgi:hypothetical protein
MENQRPNPLAKHFRQPAIYLRLPSDGLWWEDSTLAMTANKELPVYPMSTKDEILLRTPDALLNGQGVVDVIHSCVPNIKDAWKMPSVDVDAVLIAIRIATYGNNMNFDSKCTHCGEENTHEVDLGTSLSSLKCPGFADALEYRGLKIRFKPQQFFSVNKSNMIEFEEQKLLNVLNAANINDDDRAQEVSQIMDRLYNYGLTACTNSTDFIELEDGTRVNDPEFILEFYQNAESGVIKAVQGKISEFSEQSKPEGLNLACQACTKHYKVNLTFDYSNFFV